MLSSSKNWLHLYSQGFRSVPLNFGNSIFESLVENDLLMGSYWVSFWRWSRNQLVTCTASPVTKSYNSEMFLALLAITRAFWLPAELRDSICCPIKLFKLSSSFYRSGMETSPSEVAPSLSCRSAWLADVLSVAALCMGLMEVYCYGLRACCRGLQWG